MDLNKQMGERIYLIRTARGYTRECLAEMAAISSKFLYEIETGKTGFSAETLYRLCKALEVDSNAILTGKTKVEYDSKLLRTIQLFTEEQTRQISVILEEINSLLKNKI